jgi:hypothetical protein
MINDGASPTQVASTFHQFESQVMPHKKNQDGAEERRIAATMLVELSKSTTPLTRQLKTPRQRLLASIRKVSSPIRIRRSSNHCQQVLLANVNDDLVDDDLVYDLMGYGHED